MNLFKRKPCMLCPPEKKPARVTIAVPANSVVSYADEPCQVFAGPGTYTYTPIPAAVLTIRTIT